MKMFTPHSQKLYSSNKEYIKHINDLFCMGDKYKYWLIELCKECGYPRGDHYPRSDSSGSNCPRKENIMKSQYYLIPEFKPKLLIKVI